MVGQNKDTLDGLLSTYSQLLEKSPHEADELLRKNENVPEFRDLANTVRDLCTAATVRRKRKRRIATGLMLGVVLLIIGLTAIIWYWDARRGLEYEDMLERMTGALLYYNVEDRPPDYIVSSFDLGDKRGDYRSEGSTNLDERSPPASAMASAPHTDDPVRLMHFAARTAWREFRDASDEDAPEAYRQALERSLILLIHGRKAAIAWYDAAKVVEFQPDGVFRTPAELDTPMRAYERALAIGFGRSGVDYEIRARNNLAYMHLLRSRDYDSREEPELAIAELKSANATAAKLLDLIETTDKLGVGTVLKSVIYDTLGEIAKASLQRESAERHYSSALEAATTEAERSLFREKIAALGGL